ncbi:UNVERIFIED_CONTAM: hypothetical protein FKN15_018361 [Acipenser sinensis]
MSSSKQPAESRWELVRWYVKEGRFKIEERTLTAFQWLYSPYQHRIINRAELQSPHRIDKSTIAALRASRNAMLPSLPAAVSCGLRDRRDSGAWGLGSVSLAVEQKNEEP